MEAHEALRIVSLEAGVEYRITNLRAGDVGRFWIEVEPVTTSVVAAAEEFNQSPLIDELAAGLRWRAQVLAQQPRPDGFADASEGEHAASDSKQDDKHT